VALESRERVDAGADRPGVDARRHSRFVQDTIPADARVQHAHLDPLGLQASRQMIGPAVIRVRGRLRTIRDRVAERDDGAGSVRCYDVHT
jgi:hypothetical protein